MALGVICRLSLSFALYRDLTFHTWEDLEVTVFPFRLRFELFCVFCDVVTTFAKRKAESNY